MFFKRPVIDKQLSQWTDEDWKKLYKWDRKNKMAMIFTFLLQPAILDVVWWFLSPHNWSRLPKIVIAILIPGVFIWIVALIDDNVRYHRRKKRQARNIMREPENILHQMRIE